MKLVYPLVKDLRKWGSTDEVLSEPIVVLEDASGNSEAKLDKACALLQTVGENSTLAAKRNRNKVWITKPAYEATAQWFSLLDDYIIVMAGCSMVYCRNIQWPKELNLWDAVMYGKPLPIGTTLQSMLLLPVPEQLGQLHYFVIFATPPPNTCRPKNVLT